jgi:hypothetical protein
MLLAAWKTPKIARLLFFLLFAWASYTNWSFAIRSPQSYLEYADLTFLGFYKQFILGWFSKHISATIGFIATCQALIAISMLLRGPILKIGAVGAIVFLISIAPFGVGSGFPCTITMAIGLFILLRNYYHDFVWKRNKKFKSVSNKEMNAIAT